MKEKYVGNVNISRILNRPSSSPLKESPAKPLYKGQTKRLKSFPKKSPIASPKSLTNDLNLKYNPKHSLSQEIINPNQRVQSYTANLFSNAKFELDWSIYEFKNLPHNRQAEEVEERDVEEASKPQKKTTPIYDPRDYKSLPEVIFLGRCNVGKSSLINALMDKPLARVKRFAGLTPCLNMYNIGNVVRLVDSPGYGVKGKPWQGDLTMQYIREREQLRKIYLILNAHLGINEFDEMILSQLVDSKISFDLVFNKVDKISPSQRRTHCDQIVDHLLKSVKISKLMRPTLHFVSCNDDNTRSLSGISDLQLNIVLSSGISGRFTR
ncbi:BA75_05026T0 [Komagataella pastoris]|uniref:BA75_05026T0 n=1 Tax=Komagataella pastoris TaxID=4922 RepID=A0A1B2JIR0_PICPA|nr:BA75_05026T0 [Komagataella pastoris]